MAQRNAACIPDEGSQHTDTSDIALADVPDIMLVVRYGVWPANEVKEMLALGEIRKVMLNGMVYGYLAVPAVPSRA